MAHHNDKSNDFLSRREFLQTAVLGVTGLSIAKYIRAIPISGPDSDTDVISGFLTIIGDTWIEVTQTDGVQRISIDGNTTFWKGGDVYLNALAIGDDLVVRVLTYNMMALKLWSNITRSRGKVLKYENRGYVIETQGHGKPKELFIAYNENTLIGDPLIDSLPGRKGNNYVISVEDDVDVIGRRTPDGILATTIIHYPKQNISEISKLLQTKNLALLSTKNGMSPNATCTTYGHANWFDCPTGGGGCGTCSTSSAYQTAWPSIDVSGCRGRCASDCCDCARNCISVTFKNCGNSVSVQDGCTSKSRSVNIVDCGPNVTAYCSQGCGYPNCSNDAPPIIDLTKPTFTYFRDPDAGWGCFSCSASVTC